VVFIVVSQAVVDLETVKQPGFYTNLVHSGVLIGVVAYYFCAFGPIQRLSSRSLAAVLLGSCSVTALMGVVEHYTSWNLWGQYQIDDPPRIVTTLSSPGMVGAFLGTGLVLATAILVWDGPRSLRRLAIVTLVLTLPALLFTYTRGAILPAVAVAAVLVAAKPRARLVGAGVAVVLGVLLVANWSSLTGSSTYQERAPTNVYNISTRLLIATASLELAKERPVLGTGYGTFDEAKTNLTFDTGSLPWDALYGYTSHNTYLTILVELGAVGLALFVLPWLAVGVGALRQMRRRDPTNWLTLGLLGSIVVIALTALSTDLRFFSFVPALIWILVGLLRRRRWDAAFLT
jgi:O-antigen ligase